MSTWLLDENVRLSRELAVAQVRIGEQHDEITTLRASLVHAEEAIAEMQGEMSELLAASDADTMLVHDMDRELTSTKASLGRAVGALKAIGLRLDAGQVLTCSYDIQQELAVLSDSPDANLRASLGRAVEALNKLYTVWQHSYSSYSERLDAEIKPVLSDPIGQRANAEWAAMRDALQFYASPYTWAAPFGRVPPNQYSPAELDMGEKAKAALQFEKGGEG